MQTIRNFFARKKEKNATGTKAYFLTFNDRISLTQYSDPKLALEAYIKNVMAYFCISLIAERLSLLNWKLDEIDQNKEVRRTISNHPVLELLDKPYPQMTGQSFLNAVSSQKSIYGNYYIEKGYKDRQTGKYQKRPPIFLYPLRPDHMNPIEGKNHLNSEYKYCSERDFPINFEVTKLGESNVIHGMNYNPMSEYHGLSPIVPAGYSIDLHNELSKNQIGLVQNGMQPAGILTVPADVDYDADTMEVIKRDIEERSKDPSKRSRPLVLNNGMTWTQISINNADSQVDKMREMAAKEIGIAFKVPLDLLNLETSKFDNMDVADERLHYDAVLPAAQHIAGELNQGLLPMYPNTEKMRLRPDFSHTKVMRDANIRVMEKINTVTFITDNEKREMIGREPIDGGDELRKDSPTVTPEMSETIAEEMNSGLSYKEAHAMARIIHNA